MPIYEYQAIDPKKSCRHCQYSFEAIQGINEPPLTACPECRQPVRKNISRSHAVIIETSDEHIATTKQIKEFENAGMHSHAAELADKHSANIGDKNLKSRALDNYKKAGYDTKILDKHSKSED